MKKLLFLILMVVSVNLFAQTTINRTNFNGVNVYNGTFTGIDSSVSATYSKPIDWTDIYGQTLSFTYEITSTSGTATNDTLTVIFEGSDKIGFSPLRYYCDTVATIISGTVQNTTLSLSSYLPYMRIRLVPKTANKNAKNAQFDFAIVPTSMPSQGGVPLWFKSY